MDDLNMIRAGIFLTAGLITLIFPKQLNNIKNKLLKKLNIKPRDEKNSYVYLGIIFIGIATGLLIYAINN